MPTILLLGLALGLDSLRASVALGLTRPGPRRRLAVAFAFGLCDGLAPLAGFLMGSAVAERVSTLAAPLGPALLGFYGLYMLVVAFVGSREDDPRWEMFGMPVVLSVDNLVAGAGLGLLGYPVALSCVAFGVLSGLMALLGFLIADVVGRRVSMRTDAIGGAAMIVLAVLDVLERA